MTGRTRLSGLERLARRLRPDRALRPALAEAGKEVARQARRQLEADGAEEALADSVEIAPGADRVDIGSSHPRARTAEFGSLSEAPRPFLQPAFQAALGPVRARLRQVLKTHLRTP